MDSAEGGAQGGGSGGNIAQYSFDEAGGAAVTDHSGAGNHAVVIEHGSTWQTVTEAGGRLTAALDADHPLNAQLTRSLRLDIASVGQGQRRHGELGLLGGTVPQRWPGKPAVSRSGQRQKVTCPAPITVAIGSLTGRARLPVPGSAA